MVCSTKKEVSSELLPFLQVYKDGSVHRFLDSPFVPPDYSGAGDNIHVSSKDITIVPDVISARIYLPFEPSSSNNQGRFPVLLYFHGGGFCIESAFSFLTHRYITTLVSRAHIIVVSVEYRLAPEHPLPAAYQDSWTALQWITSQSINNSSTEPWLSNHANFDRIFVGGDSAGANIAHNLAIRASINPAGAGSDPGLYGVLLCQPYFLDDNGEEENLLHRTWKFVYPNAPGGFENPLINPFSGGEGEAPGSYLTGGGGGGGCSRLMVCVAEKDELKEIGIRYFDEAVKKKNGKMELLEVEGEDHCFHIFNLHTQNAEFMIKRISSFLNS